jgi:hypothetical protein
MPPSGPPEHDCADAAALNRYASDDCRETERVHERTSLGLRGCGVTSRNVMDRLSR